MLVYLEENQSEEIENCKTFRECEEFTTQDLREIIEFLRVSNVAIATL